MEVTCLNLGLTQSDIESCITAILRCVRQHGRLRSFFNAQYLARILHAGGELLRNEPMLLELEFRTGAAVVGDLHGSFIDLLLAFKNAGPPPDTEYLFLGDLVDKGPRQMEVFLFVLLLKLRWPERVHIIRGNHESYDMNADFEFIHVCEEAYPDENVYQLFCEVFDMIPVAAIAQDAVLCCHGGVSQWMTARDTVRRLTRPAYIRNAKLVENCLLCDILWADPQPEQISAFAPSTSGISYSFNEEGLDSALAAMRCIFLIRSHETEVDGDDSQARFRKKCLTVRSSGEERDGERSGSVFVFDEDDAKRGVFDVSTIRHAYSVADREYILDTQCTEFGVLLAERFRDSQFNTPEIDHTEASCWFCGRGPRAPLERSPRFLSHEDLAQWVLENASRLVTEYSLFKKLHRQMVYDDVVYGDIMLNAAIAFPLFFDVVTLKGRTFRIGLARIERTFIQEHHPGAKFIVMPVPLDVSPDSLALEPQIVSEAPKGEKVVNKDSKKKKGIFHKFTDLFRRSSKEEQSDEKETSEGGEDDLGGRSAKSAKMTTARSRSP